MLRSLRSLSNGSLRSLRCSLRAAVFVGSDETIVSQNQLCSQRVSSAPPADRRREHRGRGSRLVVAYFVGTRERKACPLASAQHGGARSVCVEPIGLKIAASGARQLNPRRPSYASKAIKSVRNLQCRHGLVGVVAHQQRRLTARHIEGNRAANPLAGVQRAGLQHRVTGTFDCRFE